MEKFDFLQKNRKMGFIQSPIFQKPAMTVSANFQDI